ncbi:TRF2-interacting telomeric protein/Rap1 C terminal domain-containing protein [Xylariaceae sp. FL0016]|nr:TRF2-interacting telomeric protein/Rap1 C terminal domain-containing protein [Xylariaceae sp. FL0016]
MSIVYTGVHAQDGKGGNLFEALKYARCQSTISTDELTYQTNNGGEVVRLEKNADYMIADPARKDAPPGSYSYHLIEDALMNGSLDYKEDYLCKPSPIPSASATRKANMGSTASRPVAPEAENKKLTRTKFTAEEDMLISRYMANLIRRGEANLAGNTVYMTFAERYPNHTWQSWRNRWTKKLSNLPLPAMSGSDPLFEDEEEIPAKPIASKDNVIPVKMPRASPLKRQSPHDEVGEGTELPSKKRRTLSPQGPQPQRAASKTAGSPSSERRATSSSWPSPEHATGKTVTSPSRKRISLSKQSSPERAPSPTHSQLARDSLSGSPEPQAKVAPTPVKETPDEIVDRFLSFGYSEDIILKALKATTWHIGNAGHVMEMLKRGEGLPQRTTGIWTQRDDDGLALLESEDPPRDGKEEKKRAKESRRLEAKHGAEMIAARRMYLFD